MKKFLLLLTILSCQAFAFEGQRDEFLTKVYNNVSNNPYDYADYVYEPFVYKKAIHKNDPEAEAVKDFYKSCDFISDSEQNYQVIYKNQDMAKIAFMCYAFALKASSDIRDRVENEHFNVSENSKYKVSFGELHGLQNRYDQALSLAAHVRARKNFNLSLASYIFLKSRDDADQDDFIFEIDRLFY